VKRGDALVPNRDRLGSAGDDDGRYLTTLARDNDWDPHGVTLHPPREEVILMYDAAVDEDRLVTGQELPQFFTCRGEDLGDEAAGADTAGDLFLAVILCDAQVVSGRLECAPGYL
jgi:hypothetical protein